MQPSISLFSLLDLKNYSFELSISLTTHVLCSSTRFMLHPSHTNTFLVQTFDDVIELFLCLKPAPSRVNGMLPFCELFFSVATTYQSYGLETRGIHSKYMWENSL